MTLVFTQTLLKVYLVRWSGKVCLVKVTNNPIFSLVLVNFYLLSLNLSKIVLTTTGLQSDWGLMYMCINLPSLTSPPVSFSHQQTKHLPSSHDGILVDLRSRREDVSADLGQADDGHHTNQQPLRQQQVQHPRSQGEAFVFYRAFPPFFSMF